MEYGEAINVLNSLASQLPGLFRLLVIGAGVYGLYIAANGVVGWASASRNNQTPATGHFAGVLIGSLMFSLGTLLNVGTMTVFNLASNHEIMGSFNPTETGTEARQIFYAISVYVYFIGWVLMFAALYVWYHGIYHREKKYGLKVILMWLLAVLATNFHLTIDAGAASLGQPSVGTQYFYFGS